MNKKGEKSLQMIFGLFILLIISLVVLSLFFKFTEKSGKQMEGASTEYFAKAAIEKAVQECKTSCDAITDINDVIEFCGKTVQIDFDDDKLLASNATKGRWDFCESKIPCFVLVDNCKNGKYTGAKCKQVLEDPTNNRVDYYNKLAEGNWDDGCGLAQNAANWKCKFDICDNAGAACAAGSCPPPP